MDDAGGNERSGTGWLERAVGVRPGEVEGWLVSSAYAFSVLAGYYVLRPVREQAGLAYGKQHLEQLYLGTLLGTLLAAPVFAWLVTRFPRRRFVPWTSHFFALNLVVFFLVCRSLPEAAARPVWGVFYSWLSVFNLFVVSVQWSLMADLWSPEQAKRLFGPIAVGGSLGAVAGSWMTKELAQVWGDAAPVRLLLLSVVFLEASVIAIRRLVRIFGLAGERAPEHRVPAERRTPSTPSARPEDDDHGGVWSGVRLLVTSPYLAAIVLYVVLQSFVSTFMYFEQAYIVDRDVPDRAGQTALFASIDLWVNAATVVIQLFLTGRIVRRFGVGFALLLQPLFAVVAFLWLGVTPALTLLVVLQVAMRSIHYATARPAREMLFTVVGRDAKYKAKNLIDTFVYRGGDALAGQVVDLFKERQWGLLAALPFAAGWVLASALVGRAQVRRARDRELRSRELEAGPAA
jgi:AAA family ATP:ADP antiporter